MFPFSLENINIECQEIDSWRTRLDAKGPLSRAWRGRLRRELEAESVHASTAMEGVAVTLEEVIRILAKDESLAFDPVEKSLVEGYQSAMSYVLRRADSDDFKWDSELLIAIHDRVLAGDYSKGAGRFRTSPRFVVDARTGQKKFTPVSEEEITKYVSQVCEKMNNWDMHPALAAAWIHISLAAIHPFGDGNGRVCRILSSLVMYRAGFKKPQFTSLEEWWGRHKEDYYQSFSCLGEIFNPNSAVTNFIKIHVSAQLSQIRSLDLREQVERQIWLSMEEMLAELNLDQRLAHALWEVFLNRPLTAGYYRALTDISPATTTNDLATLTAAKLLNPEGQRRSRIYHIGPNLLSSIANILDIDPNIAKEGRAAIISVLSNRLTD
jgi:Fic family protein